MDPRESNAERAPALSVTLLNYNYGRYLPACLDSILGQTFRDFELIVIDDKSPDDSLEVIRPYLADPRVRLVAHEKNVGYRGSLIEGTEQHSRGEFVMVISADDLVRRPDAFERQIALLRAHPGAAFCFAGYDRFDSDTNTVVEHIRSYEGDRTLSGDQFFRDYMTAQSVQVLHTGTMIRRSAYDRCGGYRRDLNICLDLAIWLVLSLEGDVAYVDENLYGYRSHSAQMSHSFEKVHANAKECVSAVEVACSRARQRGLPIAGIREEALQYILFAIAIDDAFGERRDLALARSLSALLLQPRLTLTSTGLPIVLGRLVLGQQGYARARALLRADGGAAFPRPLEPAVAPLPAVSPRADGRRIVLFINSIMMGGAEEHVRRLAIGLRGRGASVSVVMPETTEVDALAKALEAERIPVERLTLAWGTEGSGALARAMRLVRYLRRERPEVLHVHLIGYTGGRWVVWAAKVARVPRIVCTNHIAPTERQSLGVRADRTLQSLMVDRYVAVSKDNGVRLMEDLGIPRDKLTVVPNAVTMSQFEGEREPDRSRVRAELGIPRDAVVLGALARLDEQKGLTYLLQALPLVRKAHPEVHVLLVGDGPLRASLEAEARSLGIADFVHFGGYRRDTAAVLRAMDVAMLPSVREGLPLSLLEAMAAGLPVVGSRVGGIPEAVDDGVTGRLVAPRDVPSLAGAITALLDAPGELARAGAAGRARAREFSDDALLDRLLGIYASS